MIDDTSCELTYEYVKQKYMEAGFKSYIPSDSSVTIIEMNSPHEALNFLENYLNEKGVVATTSRAEIHRDIDCRRRSDGRYDCSFELFGLKLHFIVNKEYILEDDGMGLSFDDSKYKIQKNRYL